jgi:DNA invertase Pin-like site-specific DNA recombinase
MLGYRRVSTGRQARSGLGDAAQRSKIKAAGVVGDFDITGWFVDAGETGKNMDRPEFLKALEAIAADEADGLVAAKLDRIARSVQDFSALLDWFVVANKTLVVLDPPIDSSTPSGRLVANILASVAQWEAETIAARTADSLAEKRAQGLPICQPSVVDDPKLTKKIQGLRDKGLSLRAIAQTLNAEGVPTLRGAKQWQVSAIQSALGYKRPASPRRVAELPELKRKTKAA